MAITKISGFTFIHNAIDSGYPIVEAIRAVQPYVNEVVIVDMQSTDGTRELLEKMATIPIYDAYGCNYAVPLKIIDGKWGNKGGKTLRKAHRKYIKCEGDVIIHFEADEVYSDSLIRDVAGHVKASDPDNCHISVMRLQLEQNFQRCRWYPEPVHRVFPRLSGLRKKGHTTDQHDKSFLVAEKSGYLWDVTNCFRDNWFNRVNKQAELRRGNPQYIFTPIHTLHKSEFEETEAQQIIYGSKLWTLTNTPFDLPDILEPLVGVTKYEPKL
jgi:hypothetical protein